MDFETLGDHERGASDRQSFPPDHYGRCVDVSAACRRKTGVFDRDLEVSVFANQAAHRPANLHAKYGPPVSGLLGHGARGPAASFRDQAARLTASSSGREPPDLQERSGADHRVCLWAHFR
jgi:hypothetical protein